MRMSQNRFLNAVFLKTAIGFAVFLAIFLISSFTLIWWIHSPKTQRTVGLAQANDGQSYIEVIYTDYGGSYSEHGGEHLDAYLVQGSFPFKKRKKLENVEFPLGSAVAPITIKKLEEFQIRDNQLIWYGKAYDLWECVIH